MSSYTTSKLNAIRCITPFLCLGVIDIERPTTINNYISTQQLTVLFAETNCLSVQLMVR